MAVSNGTLPPHLRKAAMKNAEAPAPVSGSASEINAAPDVASPGGNVSSNEERAIVPFGKAQRTTRGDRSSIKDSYARLEENFRATNAALATENDDLHERCDELEAENETLNARCQELSDKNVELVRRCQDAERDNTRYSLQVDTLIEQNKRLGAELHDVEQKMQENEQHLEEFQRLATVKSTKSSIKQEPESTWTATHVKPAVAQLSQEQLGEVLRQLHVSYADVQRQAEEAASIRYKGVMDAQVAMQDKLERRILDMETRNDSAGDAYDGFQVESIPAEKIRLLQADLDALKTSMAVVQPQCNLTADGFETIVNRLAVLETQTQELMENKEGSTFAKTSAPHAADTDYQTKTKLRQLTEEVTKLKVFKDRIKNVRDHEQAISEAQNLEGLVEQYKKVSKAIDSNGWETSDFEKLAMEDLHTLREYVVLKYATFNARGRAFMELKAKIMGGVGGGSPVSDD